MKRRTSRPRTPGSAYTEVPCPRAGERSSVLPTCPMRTTAESSLPTPRPGTHHKPPSARAAAAARGVTSSPRREATQAVRSFTGRTSYEGQPTGKRARHISHESRAPAPPSARAHGSDPSKIHGARRFRAQTNVVRPPGGDSRVAGPLRPRATSDSQGGPAFQTRQAGACIACSTLTFPSSPFSCKGRGAGTTSADGISPYGIRHSCAMCTLHSPAAVSRLHRRCLTRSRRSRATLESLVPVYTRTPSHQVLPSIYVYSGPKKRVSRRNHPPPPTTSIQTPPLPPIP